MTPYEKFLETVFTVAIALTVYVCCEFIRWLLIVLEIH